MSRSPSPIKIAPRPPVIDVKTLMMPEFPVKDARRDEPKNLFLLNSLIMRNAEDLKKKKDKVEVSFVAN